MCKSLTENAATTMMHTFVASKVDYCACPEKKFYLKWRFGEF